jgi:hypothetical protein
LAQGRDGKANYLHSGNHCSEEDRCNENDENILHHTRNDEGDPARITNDEGDRDVQGERVEPIQAEVKAHPLRIRKRAGLPEEVQPDRQRTQAERRLRHHHRQRVDAQTLQDHLLEDNFCHLGDLGRDL